VDKCHNKKKGGNYLSRLNIFLAMLKGFVRLQNIYWIVRKFNILISLLYRHCLLLDFYNCFVFFPLIEGVSVRSFCGLVDINRCFPLFLKAGIITALFNSFSILMVWAVSTNEIIWQLKEVLISDNSVKIYFGPKKIYSN
jgi:hypothetical protein